MKNSTTAAMTDVSNSADELDQPGSENDPNTLDIVHHPAGEGPGAVAS